MALFHRLFIWLLVVAGMTMASLAAEEIEETSPMTMEILSEVDGVAPGDTFWVAIHFALESPWHAYGENPGEGGAPTLLTWQLPKGFSLQELRWPVAKIFTAGESVACGYDAPFTVMARIAVPDVMPRDPLDITLEAQWVTCSEECCQPGDAAATLSLSGGEHRLSENYVRWQKLFTAGQEALEHHPVDDSEVAVLTTVVHGSHDTSAEGIGLAWALLLALMGGLCLNLMPCVLPVISLKIMSFVKMAGQGGRQALYHAIAFSIGIVVSFWFLAALMLSLQAYGNAVGWGFQLQEPLFVAILAVVLFLLAMNLFGIFEVGALFAAWVGTRGASMHGSGRGGGRSSGIIASFSSGVLATAVATPCTGPFLGSAIGVAVIMPPLAALAIFTAMGLGMALPYLLLSAFPGLMRFVPKPGPWMQTFKELMGFLMLATVLWLVWVFGAQTDTVAVTWLLGGFLSLALGLWIYGKWATPLSSKVMRIAGLLLLLVCGGAAAECLVMATAETTTTTSISSTLAERDIAAVEWEPFDPERLESLRQRGVPVFVDFTAKWCLICQTNHLVLSSAEVRSAMAAKGFVKMKADWTKRDSVITKWLRDYGRGGVPLYLVFQSSGDVVVLPQLLTPSTILDAL